MTLCGNTANHAPHTFELHKSPLKSELTGCPGITNVPLPDADGSMENPTEFIDRRSQVYGEPVECFTRIAQVWSGILGVEIQPWQVPLCMIGLKSVRTSLAPDYSDNSDDIDGYLDIFRRIIGKDMIEARSVSEYIKQKWPNEKETP